MIAVFPFKENRLNKPDGSGAVVLLWTKWPFWMGLAAMVEKSTGIREYSVWCDR